MSNKPSSIIINKAKIDRIDPKNVELEVSASVLDKDNDSIPKSEVQLIINRENIGNILSDSDGFIDVKKILGLQEGDSLSIQFIEAIHGVKSKVKIITAEEKKEVVEVKKKKEKKEIKKEILPEKYFEARNEALKLVRTNGLNLGIPKCLEFCNDDGIVFEAMQNNSQAFRFASQRLKKDKGFIEIHILDYPDIIEYIDQSLINKEFVIKLLEINPQLFFSNRLKNYLNFNIITENVFTGEEIHGSKNFIGLENVNRIFPLIVNLLGHQSIVDLKGVAQLYRIDKIIDDNNTIVELKITLLITLLDNYLNKSTRSIFIDKRLTDFCKIDIKKCIEFLEKNCKIDLGFPESRGDLNNSDFCLSITYNNYLGTYYEFHNGRNHILLSYFSKDLINKHINILKEKISKNHLYSDSEYRERRLWFLNKGLEYLSKFI